MLSSRGAYRSDVGEVGGVEIGECWCELGVGINFDAVVQADGIFEKIKHIQIIPIMPPSSYFVPAIAVSEQLCSRAVH